MAACRYRARHSLFQIIETETNRGRFEEFETFLSGDATAVNESSTAAAAAAAARRKGHQRVSEARRELEGGMDRLRGPKGDPGQGLGGEGSEGDAFAILKKNPFHDRAATE